MVENIGSHKAHLKTLEKVKGNKSWKTSAVESVATSVGGHKYTLCTQYRLCRLKN